MAGNKLRVVVLFLFQPGRLDFTVNNLRGIRIDRGEVVGCPGITFVMLSSSCVNQGDGEIYAINLRDILICRKREIWRQGITFAMLVFRSKTRARLGAGYQCS